MTKKKRRKKVKPWMRDDWLGDFYRKQHVAWTYIVEAEGTGLIKIGRTNNLAKRLGSLRGGSPVDLILLRKIKGVEHEAILHRNLRQFRSHGEWFQKTPEVIEYMNRYRRSDVFFTPIDPKPVTSTRNLDRIPEV